MTKTYDVHGNDNKFINYSMKPSVILLNNIFVVYTSLPCNMFKY